MFFAKIKSTNFSANCRKNAGAVFKKTHCFTQNKRKIFGKQTKATTTNHFSFLYFNNKCEELQKFKGDNVSQIEARRKTFR